MNYNDDTYYFDEEDPPSLGLSSCEDEDNPFFEDESLSLTLNNDDVFQTPSSQPTQVQLPSGPPVFQNKLQSNVHFFELPNNIKFFPPNPLFFNSPYEEFEQIQDVKQIEDQSFRDAPKRAPKRKVDLSEDALHFKNEFYSVFVKKKKFEKRLVKIIHNEILAKDCVLKPMTREEGRRIDLYFQNYASLSKKIISCLKARKNEIISLLRANSKKSRS